eukprot:TRINITY_DN16806_c2_g1_i1.p1 TRINITY_DN16806_c2_g1~~TRINITY_DN16806_c2_g1_i1.p1  ORF type:complete len:654 (+),score=131.83 TRINITY_DN16806_c2_g1_i1:382-2343(+)
MLAGIFCWSLLSSVWVIVWPLSGAQRLYLGKVDDESVNSACTALAMFGPIRLLNILLTCMIVLFVPIVMIPPKQGLSAEKGEPWPPWCYVMLVRMYALVFLAQVGNCWYVYEFFEFNMTAMASLRDKASGVLPDQLEEGRRWLEANFGVTLNVTGLQSTLYEQGGLSGVDAISAMALYLVVLWCALIVTYERLTGRSFRADFPRTLLILLCPSLKRCEPIAGTLAKYYAQGQDTVIAFAERVRAARSLVLDAPARIRKANTHVRQAFLEAKEGVNEVASRARDRAALGDFETGSLRADLHEEIVARLDRSLKFTDRDLDYFGQVEQLMVDGIDGEPGKAATEIGNIVLPVSGFAETVRGILHDAINWACDILETVHVPSTEGGVEVIRESLCSRIDFVSESVTLRMDDVERRSQELVTQVDDVSKRIGDFIDEKVHFVSHLGQDNTELVREADQLVQVVAALGFRRFRWYPFFYRCLFLALSIIAYSFKVMAFSMVFLFWKRWPAPAQAGIVFLFVLFGVLIAFNNVYFSAAAAGRLSSLRTSNVVVPRGFTPLKENDSAPSAGLLMPTEALSYTLPRFNSSLSSTLRQRAGLRGLDDAAMETAIAESVSETAQKAWRLIFALPLVALAVVAGGALALRRVSSLDSAICAAVL